jgi:hypothetical protein
VPQRRLRGTIQGLLGFTTPIAVPEAGFPQIHALREGGGFDLDGKSSYPDLRPAI